MASIQPPRGERGYGQAIRDGFYYLMANHKEVICIGQGLWSPWYVGNSMDSLEKEFGKERVIDTPVSEAACTGAGIGASLCGYRPIVIHPRVDFMILATDAIVNQAAKWSHMLGGQAHPACTIRGIVNRGGQQGAQHSQSLHSWFAHVPGLRVVMPASVQDARDLLVASVLCDDPVLYIDDRWLYDQKENLSDVNPTPLEEIRPILFQEGEDVTLVGAGWTTLLMKQAAKELKSLGVTADVIDLRVLNPWHPEEIIKSVEKTGRLLVADGSWTHFGLSGEVIASVSEKIKPNTFKAPPARICLAESPAPTSGELEKNYYPNVSQVVQKVRSWL